MIFFSDKLSDIVYISETIEEQHEGYKRTYMQEYMHTEK